MKKFLLTVAIAFASITIASAQTRNSVGVSYSPAFTATSSHAIGIEFKHYFSERNDLDIRAHYCTGGWGPEFIGLYEWNFPISDTFKAYAGPGAHIGFVPKSAADGSGRSTMTTGVAGVGGIEYDFLNIPLGISLDWQPLLVWQTTYTGTMFAWQRLFISVKLCF